MSDRRHGVVAVWCLSLFAGCVSVPRDAGVGDVQKLLRERAQPAVEWRPQPMQDDDSRVPAMLAGELDAERAVEIALLNNPRVQMALADLGLARADLIAASTVRNPILGGEIRFPGRPEQPLEVTITQTLFDLAQLPRRRQAGRATFEGAKLRVAADLVDFAAEVRVAYYDLLASTQRLAMDRTILEAAAAAAELAQRQHAAGNITDLDLEQEQAVYERAKLDLAQSEANVLLGREELIRAMGLRQQIDFEIAEEFPAVPPAETDEAELIELARSRRLDLAAVHREVEALERLLPVSRLAEIGDLEAGYHVEREPEGARTAGPALEVPLPVFNRGRAGRARTEAELVRARQQESLLEGALASEMRSARNRVIAARARVEYYRDVVLPRRRRIVELTLLEHNAMAAGVFQLLQAKQSETEGRREFIAAQRDYWMARSEQDRAASGRGSAMLAVEPSEVPRGRSAAGIRGDH